VLTLARVVAIEQRERDDGNGDEGKSQREPAHRALLEPLLVLCDRRFRHVSPSSSADATLSLFEPA
jgi:hypothetical protein